MWRVNCPASIAAMLDYVGERRSDAIANGRAGNNGRIPVWVRVRRTTKAFILLWSSLSSFRENNGTKVVMPTCNNGKFWLKSVLRTDSSNRLKKDACAPTPTLSVVVALAHACVISAVDVEMVKSVEASRFTNTVEEATPLKAVTPMSN